MKTIKTDPFTGIFSFVQAIATGNPYPDKQLTTEVGTTIVDTSLPKDTLIWETGIKRKSIEGKWVIVEQYEDEEQAKIGHDKWVKTMTEFPDLPLKDIDMWSLEDLDEKRD